MPNCSLIGDHWGRTEHMKEQRWPVWNWKKHSSKEERPFAAGPTSHVNGWLKSHIHSAFRAKEGLRVYLEGSCAQKTSD